MRCGNRFASARDRREAMIDKSVVGVIVVVILAALLLSGCGLIPTRTVVKPQVVEVSKYVRAPLPAQLVQPCRYAEPDPACWRDGQPEFCNEQLLAMRLDYRHALNKCDDDKTALRALGPPDDG